MLADIGIERGQIAEVADYATIETGTEPRLAEQPLSRRMGRFVQDRVVAPIQRAYRRQVAYRELSALDDYLLRDIGLTRGDIPYVVRALSEMEAQSRETADADHDVLRSIRLWNRSRSAARALHALDDHMLSDIGLVRGDVDMVAEELASRSLRKPANRNTASKAA
jgi:uncharacterized protein YjiS (DUF1127 family)